MQEKMGVIQKNVLWIFYAALIVKTIAVYVPEVEFVSSVLLGVFFLAELVLMPPLGMGLMCLMTGALYFVLPAVVQFLVRTMVESVILVVLSGIVCILLSGVVITVVGTWIVSIQVVVVTAPLALTMGIAGGSTVLGMAVGWGVKAAASGISRTARWGKGLKMLLLNVLVFAVIGWPVLSYAQAITGVMAFKPAVILNQQHMDYLNMGGRECEEIFTKERQWVFRNYFYNDVISQPNNNIAQGETNLIAGNDRVLAVALNGLVYVQTADMKQHICGAAYRVQKGDAMVLSGREAFIFGRDRVFLVGDRGTYMWKDTSYVTEFEKLSWEEKCERLYDILQRQNTGENIRFSYEEVGLVARAQKSGLLLSYNSRTQEAFFTREAGKDALALVVQSAPGERREAAQLSPDASELGLMMVKIGTEGVLYTQGRSGRFMAEFDGWNNYNTFTHPQEKGRYRTVNFGWVNRNYDGERYSAYLDSDDCLWLDTRNIGRHEVVPFQLRKGVSKLVGFAGKYLYTIQYEDNLLSRLTYIHDVREAAEDPETSDTSGYKAHEIWMESWSFQRIPLDKERLLSGQ